MTKCIICSSPAAENHHVWYGRANRKLSEKYGLIVPLCRYCHNTAHGKHGIKISQSMTKKILCNKMRWDYDKINYAINTYKTNPESKLYLEQVAKQIKESKDDI